MPITLPINRSKVSAGSRKRSGIRASSANVDIVSPSVSRVSPLSVPKAAFETTAGAAAQEVGTELVTSADRLLKAEIIVQDRADTLERIDLENQFDEQNAAELDEAARAEGGLSGEGVMEKLGASMDAREAELKNNHNGRAKSQFQLSGGLANRASASRGKAAGIAAAETGVKAEAFYKKELNPIIGSIQEDPKAANLDAQLLAIDALDERVGDALTVSKESELFPLARELAVVTAVKAHLNNRHPELALLKLSDPRYKNLVSGPERTRLVTAIQSFKASKNTVINNWNQKKAILRAELGRDPTPAEVLRGLSLASPGGSVRQDKIAGVAKRLNGDVDQATDIVDGNVFYTRPDSQDRIFKINKLDNTKVQVGAKELAAVEELAPEQIVDSAPKPETELEAAARKGTGPIAKTKQLISDVFGFLTPGTDFEPTTDARQKLKIFAQTAKEGFLNNQRAPVAEQEVISKFMIDVDNIAVDPDTEARKMGALREAAEGFIEGKKRELKAGKNLNVERKDDLNTQISQLNELLFQMNKVAEKEPLPAGIPKGSVLVEGKTTPKGNPVYRTPEGKLVGSKE